MEAGKPCELLENQRTTLAAPRGSMARGQDAWFGALLSRVVDFWLKRWLQL